MMRFKENPIILSLAIILATTGVYGAGEDISDHILQIEMSTTYDYGLPGDQLFYEFDAWIQVDKKVASGSLQVPDGEIYEMEYEKEDGEIWLGVYAESPSASLLNDFGTGTYIFTVNYKNGTSDSTSIDYVIVDDDLVVYITQQPQFIYPLHNAVDAPLELTLEFDPAVNSENTIGVCVEPANGSSRALSYEDDGLPYDTGTYGPITLSADTDYDAEYTINNTVRTVNSDGIPVVMDTDAECEIRFTTRSALGTPKAKIFAVDDTRISSYEQEIGIQVSGNADRYKVWEKGTSMPSEWLSLPNPEGDGYYYTDITLEPYEPGSSDFGAKRTVYLKIENEDNESKTAKIKFTLQLPKASSLKVNGNNKASQNDVPVTFKVQGDATSYYLSGDPDILTDVTSGLLDNLSEPVNGVYTIPSFDLSTVDTDSKGKKTVYLMLENEVGVSNISRVVVTMQVPKASSLKVNGNNKAEQNDVPVTFKVKGDATSYYLSGDPDMLTGITSGLLANLSEPVNGVYTIPSFDLSTVDTNSKGKKTVYLMLENEVGVSRVIKVSVKMLQ